MTTTYTPDGNKSITKNADGQTVSSMELRDNKEILTKYEYSNGNTIAREYADGAQIPSSIIVSGRSSENGPTTTIETKYNSEDDMKNNRPSSKTENKGLPTETTTTFEYDSKGNKKFLYIQVEAKALLRIMKIPRVKLFPRVNMMQRKHTLFKKVTVLLKLSQML